MRALLQVVIFLLVPLSSLSAAWEPDPGDALQMKSAKAVTAFRDKVERTAPYFEQAYAFAVFPSVTRVGFGFGGAYGKGIVVEGERAVGTTKFWQFTSGIQAGVRNFAMIVFFRDKEALDYFRSEKIQFMGQAGLAFATVGVAGTPAYNDGVAVVTMTRLGLMGEFTVSGARFRYKPLEPDR